jgi:hypothetical protein
MIGQAISHYTALSTSWIGPTSISSASFVFTLCSSFFVVRTKKNILLQRRYSHPVDKSTGVRSDHSGSSTSGER